jgi:hypothetical protein
MFRSTRKRFPGFLYQHPIPCLQEDAIKRFADLIDAGPGV